MSDKDKIEDVVKEVALAVATVTAHLTVEEDDLHVATMTAYMMGLSHGTAIGARSPGAARKLTDWLRANVTTSDAGRRSMDRYADLFVASTEDRKFDA